MQRRSFFQTLAATSAAVGLAGTPKLQAANTAGPGKMKITRVRAYQTAAPNPLFGGGLYAERPFDAWWRPALRFAIDAGGTGRFDVSANADHGTLAAGFAPTTAPRSETASPAPRRRALVRGVGIWKCAKETPSTE